MVATRYSELVKSDELYMDSRWAGVSPKADIHGTVRLEPFSVIDEGVTIGEDTIIGPFNHIRPGTKIGKRCIIGGHGTFEGNCSIGNEVRIGTHANVGWNCHIDDLVFIGGQFTGGNDKRMVWKRVEHFEPKGYHIRRGARIGLGVVLVPEIIIGEEALIGAGSLVTRTVPPFEIWYGHPAVKRGVVPENERLR